MYSYLARYDISSQKKQYLKNHLNGVTELSYQFAQKINARLSGKLIGLLHDFGKYSDEFQLKLKSNMNINCDHSTAGAIILSELSQTIPGGKIKFLCEVLELTILSHHGGLIDVINHNFENDIIRRLNKISPDDIAELKSRGAEILDKAATIFSSDEFREECNSILSKLDQFEAPLANSLERKFAEHLFVKFFYSCLIDADRLDSISAIYGKNKIEYAKWSDILAAVAKKVNTFPKNELNIVRSKIFDECAKRAFCGNGFFKLNIPTGGGKTLSSLNFAINHAIHNRMDRIIYVIPYITIIEQNAEVVRNILKDAGLDENFLFESHSNIVRERDEQTPYYYSLQDNWSGQIIFTTMVQFLESIFGSGTQGIRRMHNLANSVIIFDEIQSLPIKCVYTATMLMRFLVEHCKSSVVLCSATQPLLDNLPCKERSVSNVIEIKSNNTDAFVRTKIKNITINGGYEYDEIISLAVKSLIDNNSVLIITNTKKCAVSLYELAKEIDTAEVFYLSTDLCANHRLNVIDNVKSLLKQDKKVICISTQLIEAGVDIDFNCVYRFLCGLDSIIQSAGRCNREGKLKYGNVYIINSKNENLSRLTDIKEGQIATSRVLTEIENGLHSGDIMSESAINAYFKYYFYYRKSEMEYNLPKENTTIYNLLSSNKSMASEYIRINKKQETKLLQAFKTASQNYSVIENRQIGVIVPYREGKELICNISNMKPAKLLKKAQRYTVNIYEDRIEMYKGAVHQAPNGVYYADELYYDDKLGLNLNKKQIEFGGGLYG